MYVGLFFLHLPPIRNGPQNNFQAISRQICSFRVCSFCFHIICQLGTFKTFLFVVVCRLEGKSTTLLILWTCQSNYANAERSERNSVVNNSTDERKERREEKPQKKCHRKTSTQKQKGDNECERKKLEEKKESWREIKRNLSIFGW